MNSICFHLNLLSLRGYFIPWKTIEIMQNYEETAYWFMSVLPEPLTRWEILSRWVSNSKAGWMFWQSKSFDVRELPSFGLRDMPAPWMDQGDLPLISLDKFQGLKQSFAASWRAKEKWHNNAHLSKYHTFLYKSHPKTPSLLFTYRKKWR